MFVLTQETILQSTFKELQDTLYKYTALCVYDVIVIIFELSHYKTTRVHNQNEINMGRSQNEHIAVGPQSSQFVL